MKKLIDILKSPGPVAVGGAPQGVDALLLARILPELAAFPGREERAAELLHVATDDAAMARMAEALAFFLPELEIVSLPAWDCLPYDRVSPNSDIVSRRIDGLIKLAEPRAPSSRARIALTTVNAVLQRLPEPALLQGARFAARTGETIDLDKLTAFLEANGYGRSETVMEPGEYALRGGIVDVYPPGSREPLRLDLFGDTLERIRSFDAMSQRSTGILESFDLKPVSEVLLNPDSIARFRSGYREVFGTSGDDDPLYEAVSAGRRHVGMEHWLPLFQPTLATIFDYAPGVPVTLDARAPETRDARLEQIAEFYTARKDLKRPRGGGEAVQSEIYNPLPPDSLYLTAEEWAAGLAPRAAAQFSPFAAPEGERSMDAGGRIGVSFASARHQAGGEVFATLGTAISEARKIGRRIVFAAYSKGSRERMSHLFGDRGIHSLAPVEAWPEVAKLPPETAAMAVLGLENGFSLPDLMVVSEQDVFGERLSRPARRSRRSDAFLREIASIDDGDLVVHVDHGIGRYDGLITLEIAGAAHDCLRILYDGNDKLFVPVENIDVLSRYGEDQGTVALDKLGGAAWQARKAKLKKRIRDMAEQLLRIAAARLMSRAEPMPAPEGLYEEFAARFPYQETDDQASAIEDTLKDLATDKPMDRLICGDVGFGKTEVALRAAFVAAMAGVQVAVVVPTTLLARQHYESFRKRFEGYPVRVMSLSRLVNARDSASIKKELADGTVNVIVGTHALLAKSIKFHNLGLLIIDEEQHFGVTHKERLKSLKSNIHVLTLTATPIPRTLQLALTGVKELSIIATPPVDRLAVRTFVLPTDPVVLREALLRERFRGGQSFYVCPRVADLEVVREQILDMLPDARCVAVHGQMTPTALEDAMAAFYAGTYEILLSTNIIESGLDMPNVNTMMIHRADMFGLAQLYQLRGRVGRGKLRAYAYLTLPPGRKLTKTAEKRLQVMQTLDNLGAGFTLASHDLDIRGAGNLLGDEQSGHIREVGIELYQQMLEEAVANLKGEGNTEVATWTPQIGVGIPILIPEAYVPDLGLRLGLYRRIANVLDQSEVDALAAEIVDRFGPLPDEVDNLLKVVALKPLCRAAGVEKIDAGPKGAVIGFHANSFANPAGLVQYISNQAGSVKLRPDQKLVIRRNWEDVKARMSGLQKLAGELVAIATQGKAA